MKQKITVLEFGFKIIGIKNYILQFLMCLYVFIKYFLNYVLFARAVLNFKLHKPF